MTTAFIPIPWEHELSEIQAIWVWDTDAFTVRVLGDIHSCYFTVTDKLADPDNPEVIADGQAASFHQAEYRIRELIGKAYPQSLGFSKYAGSLATTFTISNGTRIDFGPYEGLMVTVEVFTGKDSSTAITGELRIDNYYLSIIRGTTLVNVRPTHVKALSVVNKNKEPRTSRFEKLSGRTYRSNWEAGCTGKNGFLTNMVDHYNSVCPIHER
jgi:hypothetical protein